MALVVVVVAVVEAAVGTIELQGERERERERLTVSSVELQRGHCQMQKKITLASYNNAMSSCYKFS